MRKKMAIILLVTFVFACKEKPVAVNYQQNYEGRISAAQSKLIYTEAKGFFNQTQLSLAIIKAGKTKYYGIKIENDTLFSVENQNRVF